MTSSFELCSPGVDMSLTTSHQQDTHTSKGVVQNILISYFCKTQQFVGLDISQ